MKRCFESVAAINRNKNPNQNPGKNPDKIQIHADSVFLSSSNFFGQMKTQDLFHKPMRMFQIHQ